MQHDSVSAADRVNFAKSEGIDSALRDYVGTGEALEKVPNIKRCLQIMLDAPGSPRLDVPKLDITLRDWQVDLLARPNCQPVSHSFFCVRGLPAVLKQRLLPTSNKIMKVAH